MKLALTSRAGRPRSILIRRAACVLAINLAGAVAALPGQLATGRIGNREDTP